MSRTTSYNMHDHDSIPSQYLLLFLGETLASLPYKFEEEPLYLIYLIDRVLTIHGTNTIDHANTLLKSRRANDSYLQADLEEVYSSMYGLIVLFELRKHLKKIFHLTATRIKKFDQSAPLREENPPGKSIVHSIPTFRTPKDLDGMTKKSARARKVFRRFERLPVSTRARRRCKEQRPARFPNA